jgi:hypothetical protein
MPRTTGTIQRALPTSAPARVVKPQPRLGFNPPSPPARVVNAPARVASFTAPRPARMTMTQAASQMLSANPVINPINLQPAANACCCAACSGLQCLDRTRFFSGQLLTDADLNNEQSYLLAKNRLHNLYLHGSGVVCGLQVTCSDCPGVVNISPGYAIDPCGNDIIVCTAQTFNVINAIQTCCTPPPQTTNCSPVRYSPPPTCQQQIQTWCITIQYQEQQTNMVTPLQPVASSGCSCGCGSSNCSCGSGSSMGMSGGCGCGCGCKGNGSSSSSSSTCASSTTSSSTAACQPTRILETFQLGVCQQTPQISQKISPVELGTFGSQFQSYQQLNNLLNAKPALLNPDGSAAMSNTLAYQATSQYLTSARNTYINAGITNCELSNRLDGFAIPQPTANDPTDATYAKGLQSQLDAISTNIVGTAFDRFCNAMMPPCPPVPCDNRLILACVTVCNNQIMSICQFGGGRKLLVGFPTIAYWLSLWFPSFGKDFGAAFERLCCGQDLAAFFNGDTYSRAILSGTTGNPAMFNGAVTSYVAQRMGSAMVNAASPLAATVDLRPLIGLQKDEVTRKLQSYGILAKGDVNNANANAIKVSYVDVSTDPAWTDNAINAAASYAPSAFKISNPLTVYTRGPSSGTVAGDVTAANPLVVGFALTSPTDYLTNQITQLQKQIDGLNSQLSAQPTPVTPPANASVKPGKKK